MKKDSKIYIAGHRGLVGSAILKKLKQNNFFNFVLRTHKELDLMDTFAVDQFFEEEKPEYVFLAAAKVGGIVANNTYRANFIYENLMIQNNVIHQAYRHGVKKLMFLGSTCIYPKNSLQPIKEESLLTGDLEYTNEPYAIAKIAGIVMCESYNIQYGTNFISVMPTNIYGPNDNFNLETSHVLPALLRKVYLGKSLEENNWEAIKADLNQRPIEGVDGNSEKHEILRILDTYGIKINRQDLEKPEETVAVEIWGSGNPLREFLWSEDLADACVYLMRNINFEDIVDIHNLDEIHKTQINIGTGEEISIKELAYLIKKVIGFKGSFFFNSKMPDGTLRKITDISRLHRLGWKHVIELEEGIGKMYREMSDFNKSDVEIKKIKF